MEIVSLPSIGRALDPGQIYREFLRVPALSLGYYRHFPGQSVPQTPHGEDEIYYVISGRGVIEIAGKDYGVEAGALIYVPALEPHHFHSVIEALEVLVMFAPAEGSGASAV